MRRNLLLAALAVVALLAAPFVAAFAGLAPLVDEELPGLGRVVKDGYVGIGLIDVGEGRVALVDAGNDPAGTALGDALAARGASFASVDAVFLTHGHPDHVAALPLLPNATVYAMAEEGPWLAGEHAFRAPLTRLFGPMGIGGRAVTAMHDGDIVRVGARTFEGFLVPGHTPGSACWLVGEVLFVGDNATIEAGGALRPAPWIFSDDTAENRASLRALPKRLGGHAVSRIVASHSGSATGPAALITFAE